MKKNNLILLSGVLIPFLVIVFVVVSIFAPRFFTKGTEYDFIYTVGDTYDYYGDYNKPAFLVADGKIVPNQKRPMMSYEILLDYQKLQKPQVKLFLHDPDTDVSREISLAEAEAFNVVSDDIQSPDGYEFVPGNRSDGLFPFFSGSSQDYAVRYLKKGLYTKKLNLQYDSAYYYDKGGLSLIGWVK